MKDFQKGQEIEVTEFKDKDGNSITELICDLCGENEPIMDIVTDSNMVVQNIICNKHVNRN